MARFMLRLPTELHAAMVEWAKAEHRSLNGMIVHILTAAAREWRARETHDDQEEAA